MLVTQHAVVHNAYSVNYLFCKSQLVMCIRNCSEGLFSLVSELHNVKFQMIYSLLTNLVHYQQRIHGICILFTTKTKFCFVFAHIHTCIYGTVLNNNGEMIIINIEAKTVKKFALRIMSFCLHQNPQQTFLENMDKNYSAAVIDLIAKCFLLQVWDRGNWQNEHPQ